ncbi:uncharacterized protein TNCV_4255311 [Trichonephila clavipes]|nr:uncharacterized protein TNCV_4255311 [Trichonephila clavipes]
MLRARRRYPRAENRVWSDQEDHEERESKDRAASTCGLHSDSFNDTSRRPFLNGLPGAIFQQVNARPHTARVAQDFLRHFQTLPWPAHSPDLSPVEHVRDQLKRIVQTHPRTRILSGEVGLLEARKISGRTVRRHLEHCQVIYSQFGLAIHQNDHQARRRFVEWAQNEIAVVPDFHKRILFSDEAHFWLNGYVNKQNCRIWSEANPQVYAKTSLHPEKLTVWCSLWAGGILLQNR